MATPRSAEDLLASELKSIYSAERQLSRALPKLSRKASAQALRQQLEVRQEQGARLMDEVEQALDELGATKGRPKNPAAEGLIEDMKEMIDELGERRLIDPVLLAETQKLEHYCIASWGTARSLAQLLAVDDVVTSMSRALEEGKSFDAELTELAQTEINPAMLLEGDMRGPDGGARTSRPERRPST